MNTIFLENEENDVYLLLKEYLRKNSFFSMEEIINFLSQRLKKTPNINRNKIELILKALIKKKKVIPGRKLVKENILEIPKRKQIFEHIENNPGTNINEIMKVHDIGSNHVIWHLKFLELFQFVRFEKLGNKKAYFKFELDPSYDKIYFYLRNEKVKKIVGLLEKNKSTLKPIEISNQLKMHYDTTKKYLDILKEMDWIKTFGQKKTKSYTLNKKKYYETLQNLNILY